MSDLKPCPFLVRMCSMDGQIIGYTCKGECANCPAEDAKDREIERLNNELGIQKNLTRQACFEANRAYDEVEKWKQMFYDLVDKKASVSTDPKVIVVGTDTNVPANAPDTGKMEEN